MSYNVTIQPLETSRFYNIESPSGYQIKSSVKLSGEYSKIKDILAAYVELSIAQENFVKREAKFTQNVSWQPQSEWKNEPEYRLYQTALNRLKHARRELNTIKDRFHVISITPF
jgi:hypothetical protein